MQDDGGVIRVLVFPCGSEPALEIHAALRYCVNIELYGASSRSDHGEFVYRNYIGDMPYIDSAAFLGRFNEVLIERRIDVVFPTHDTVANVLSARRGDVLSRLCVGDHRTVSICRNKAEIYATFADEVFCPRVYTIAEAARSGRFPVFLKPAVDEGGKGARLIRDADELDFYSQRTSNPVVMEHLPGDEYTVDCFTDRHGKLRFAGPGPRDRVWGGIAQRSTLATDDADLAAMAERINKRLGFRGLWFFQVKRDQEGHCRLLEISSRVAGTMSVYRVQGVNLPLLTVYDAMDRDVCVAPNRFSVMVERALMNRYRLGIEYDAVYVDLDDTLICAGRVNGVLMTFLYQAREAGKRLILITKHKADVDQTLARHRIARSLFDEIVRLEDHERKLDKIHDGTSSRPILIDNSFNERLPALSDGLAVFDVDAVPGLIDWTA